MANINPELDLLKAKLLQSPLPTGLRQRAERMLARLAALEQMSNFSLQELEIVSKYIDWVCLLPFNSYTHDNLDINNAQKVLDKKINIYNFAVKPETIVLDQFEGYKNIEGVQPESNTHTYFKATFLHEDIEFKLFSAKAQDKNEKRVKITFTDKTQHTIHIDEMSEFGKTPHEQIIKDFVSDSKKLSINIDDALNQWGIVEQLQI